MRYSEIKKKLIKDEKYLQSVRELNKDVLYRIGRMISEARVIKGLTQTQLAKKLETKQPAIARFENGKGNISIKTLMNMADVFETDLITPKFEFMRETEEKYDNDCNYSSNEIYYFSTNREESSNKENASGNLLSIPSVLNYDVGKEKAKAF
jgi:transcriptional regulator with XRE-family HTH domain